MPEVPDAPARAGLTLILGGARSGKSRVAESVVEGWPPPWVYVATAQALDDEMAERIALHRSGRRHGWQTIDAPLELPDVIQAVPAGTPLLIDCLTLWLSNLMLARGALDSSVLRLEGALRAAAGPVVVVSNEVGCGIVPENALARSFRDAQGRLNQRVAMIADRVELVVAGLPVRLK